MPRKAVRRPEMVVLVQDDQGSPVANATVRLATGAHPHRVWKEEASASTDNEGHASFAGRQKWEVVYPFWIHGVPQYFWILCVQAPGYGTFVEELRTEESATHVSVVLKKADSDPTCDTTGLWPHGAPQDSRSEQSEADRQTNAPLQERQWEEEEATDHEEPSPDIEAEEVSSD